MTAQTGGPASALVFAQAGEFLKTLRARIDTHLGAANRKGDARLVRKAVLILAWFGLSYGLLFATQSGWLQLVLCLSYAFATAAIGFNIFHDANHGTFSPNPAVNVAVSKFACTLIGVGRHFWRYKHNVLHHRFTNIFGWDDDLETRGNLRLSPRQPWKPKYKNQQWFVVFLYGMTTIEWIFIKDFVQYFTLRINQYQAIPAMTPREKREFWISKAVYYAIFVALPFFFLPAWKVLVGLFVFHFTLSVTLALIFNLAHIVQELDFPAPAADGKSIEAEWAAVQMQTTLNFANDNPLMNWYSGGLNFQVEHHLFPNISHTHYPDIRNIVKDTAAEFGLPYHVEPTYFGTIRNHFRMLRDLGREPVAAAA